MLLGALLLLVTMLSSCSSLSSAVGGAVGSLFGTGGGISATAVNAKVGDTVGTINNMGPTVFWQLLCIIGWMAPSPATIYKEVKSLFYSLGRWLLKLLRGPHG